VWPEGGRTSRGGRRCRTDGDGVGNGGRPLALVTTSKVNKSGEAAADEVKSTSACRHRHAARSAQVTSKPMPFGPNSWQGLQACGRSVQHLHLSGSGITESFVVESPMLIVLPLDSADAATKWTSNFVGVPALTSGIGADGADSTRSRPDRVSVVTTSAYAGPAGRASTPPGRARDSDDSRTPQPSRHVPPFFWSKAGPRH